MASVSDSHTTGSLLSAQVQPEEPQCSLNVGIASPNQQSRDGAAADIQLPAGWVKLTDCYGTYYGNANLNTFQRTHPSLNAPPFALEMTDYNFGHPAPDAPAWAWMMYLWLREVKSTHSVVGTLCAVSLCGRRLCAPPRDTLFQRRTGFRIWLLISFLLASLCFHASLTISFGASELGVSPFSRTPSFTSGQLVRECGQSRNCFWKPAIIQAFVVSLPFGIYRCAIFACKKTASPVKG
jgi:hypothetical protein